MSDQLPDRLSINPKSPYYNEEILKREVGIRFNGAEKTNVEEYCVSEGWIRVAVGRKFDRHGNPLLMKNTLSRPLKRPGMRTGPSNSKPKSFHLKGDFFGCTLVNA